VRSVGVRDFRDHATEYLASSQAVAITRHGRVIGFYVPVPRDDRETVRALDRLGSTVDRILASTEMTEEELSELVDVRRDIAT
jgi:antitoxin (DNA-binding transcriptional repressor) of toxin-antitoxin stability system